MKPTPEDLTNYYNKLKEFEQSMELKKPNPLDFVSIDAFNKALSEWNMAWFCDRPNKPGYEFANND